MSRSPDRFRSVQVRTTALAMLTLVVVLAGGAVGLLRFFERQQVQELDKRLSSASTLVRQLGANPAPTNIPASVGAAGLVQVVDSDDTVVFASDRMREQPPLIAGPSSAAPRVRTADAGPVGSVRVIEIPFGENRVLLAESLKGVDDAVSGLRTALLVGVPILALVLGGIIWIVVGRTLRPVRRAIEREQQLVADVSHELRTPLAGARALLESESTVPAEIELNRLEALNVIARLESVADDLLVGARLEHDDASRTDALVDLDDVVLRVVDEVQRPIGVGVDTSGVSGGQVRGDEQQLARMISNLLTNAVRHAESEVQITLRERGEIVALTVSDDGPGIAAEDRERVFERFTRLDDARSRDGAGAGLGLPIARSLALAHRGTIEVCANEAGGAVFAVMLPASTPDATTTPVTPSRASS
jgi:signal transduction histidine kinase